MAVPLMLFMDIKRDSGVGKSWLKILLVATLTISRRQVIAGF